MMRGAGHGGRSTFNAQKDLACSTDVLRDESVMEIRSKLDYESTGEISLLC